MKYIPPIIAWILLLCTMLPGWAVGFVAGWVWTWTYAGFENAQRFVVVLIESRWLKGKS